MTGRNIERAGALMGPLLGLVAIGMSLDQRSFARDNYASKVEVGQQVAGLTRDIELVDTRVTEVGRVAGLGVNKAETALEEAILARDEAGMGAKTAAIAEGGVCGLENILRSLTGAPGIALEVCKEEHAEWLKRLGEINTQRRDPMA